MQFGGMRGRMDFVEHKHLESTQKMCVEGDVTWDGIGKFITNLVCYLAQNYL